MRTFSLITIIALLLSCTCVRRFPDPDGQDARDVMTQTVKISISVAGMQLSKGEDGGIVAEERVIEWMGSGVVLDVDLSKGKGESLIATAAHVSNIPQGIPTFDEDGNLETLFLPQASLTIVQTLEGKSCAAEAVYADIPHDIGIVKAFCIAGEKAELAELLPPIGSAILVSGAGLGYHPDNVFLVEDGRYLGLEDGRDPSMIMSVPVVGGHSGSGIFHKGKVIGILTKVFVRFHHGSFGTELSHVRVALEAARENWN